MVGLRGSGGQTAGVAAPHRVIDVRPGDPSQGLATAPVTIVEFADFECPFCRQLSHTLRDIKQKYGDRVRLVWKDFPLPHLHPHAVQAAAAARCAAEQQQFWLYHDRLFGAQTLLDADSLKRHAADVGLDAPKLAACVDSAKYVGLVERARADALALGLRSTPTTFVNGREVVGAKSYEVFAALVEEELARASR